MKKVFGLLKNVVIGLFVLAILGAVLGGGSKDKGSSQSTSQASAEAPAAESEQVSEEAPAAESEPVVEEAPVIEYQSVTVDDLIAVLKNNPMNAKNTYEGANIRLTGFLTNIDASGKYFDLDNGDEWSFDSIHCSINDDATRNRIASASMGDQLTACGTVTSVGEIMGYSMDVSYIE